MRVKRFVSTASPLLLEGIRVLDLSRILAAPFASQLLGDMGATVWKIEHPETGDDTRTWGPPFTQHGDESAYFLSVNRNKKSLAINLKDKEGQDIVRDLAKQADVVLENFPQGKLDALGLGYDSLSKINPGLVYCSVTGFGQTGPYRDRLAYDVMVSGIGGLMGITGSAEAPAKVGVAISDVCAGLYAHGAILAALMSKQRTGNGVQIDVSLLDTQIATLVNVASSYLVSGVVPRRYGTAHASIVPYEAFEASNGHFITGALNDGQFERMCTAMGLSHLACDPKFDRNRGRVANREELLNILRQEFKKKPVAEWLALLEDARVPAGPINNLKQVFEDPHVDFRHMRQEVSHPSAGNVPVVSPPVRFNGEQSQVRFAPPLLGQHTEEVLKSVLGYSGERISELRSKGSIK